MYVVGIILIVVLIFAYYATTVNVSEYEKYFYGLWVGDDDFCSNANVSSMMLFIGEPTTKWFSSKVERSCYMIIQDDIASEQFTMKYSTGYGGPYLGKYTVAATCEFESDDLFEGNRVTLTINLLTGILVIRNGDHVYGKLYKQHDISNILAI